MSRFTKALRQEIVREFAIRHNGQFNPVLFVEEVRDRGADHPAHGWFDWDKDNAAFQFWVQQAREFTRDLKVSFRIEEVGRKKAVSIREVKMPALISPAASRSKGGGYVLVEASEPDHMIEHCHQAATALSSWIARYQSAIEYAGGSVSELKKQIRLLQNVKSKKKNAA
jgi:hypothetical protein